MLFFVCFIGHLFSRRQRCINSDLHDQWMADVVDGSAIYIARAVARSVVISIAFVVAAAANDVVVQTTQIRIIHATRVDIYTVATPRTGAGVARTDAGSERSSSVHVFGDRITVVADRLCKLARRNAGRALTAAVVSERRHI